MTEKELKHLSRQELLEMLVLQSKKLDRAKQSLREAEDKLAQRKLDIHQSGNLAEAALRINGFFAAAQTAADDYVARAKELNDSAQEHYDAVLESANREAQRILDDTAVKCREMVGESADKMESYLRRIRPELWEASQEEEAEQEPAPAAESDKQPAKIFLKIPFLREKPREEADALPIAQEQPEEAAPAGEKEPENKPAEKKNKGRGKKEKAPEARPQEAGAAEKQPKSKKPKTSKPGNTDNIFEKLEKRSQDRKNQQL